MVMLVGQAPNTEAVELVLRSESPVTLVVVKSPHVSTLSTGQVITGGVPSTVTVMDLLEGLPQASVALSVNVTWQLLGTGVPLSTAVGTLPSQLSSALLAASTAAL